MKLECLKEKIQQGLELVEKGVGKNTSLPILSCVLIKNEDNRLTIKSTNLEIGVEVEVSAKIHSEGQAAVKPGVLLDLLSNIRSDEKIEIEKQNDNLIIKTSNSDSVVKCLSDDEFPTLPQPQTEDSVFTLNSTNLIQGIKSVVYSAAVSDIKPEISSVYLYHEEGELVFVATDSFRLAEKRLSVGDEDLTGFPGLIIPLKNTQEIVKIFNQEKEIKISTNENQLFIIGEDIFFTSRVVDGVYPDYKQIIPKEFKTEVLVSKEELIRVLKLANIFSNKFNQVEIEVDPEGESIMIRSESDEVGENSTVIKGEISGVSQKTNLNARYLLDCFQSVSNDDRVLLKWVENHKPLIIKGEKDNTFTYLLMPVSR